jgi:hypothetical protein
MGANSKQGWCLFAFLIGFTFLVGGLAYLGFIFSIGGLALLIGSLVGFHAIRPLEHSGAGTSAAMEPPPMRTKQKQAL